MNACVALLLSASIGFLAQSQPSPLTEEYATFSKAYKAKDTNGIVAMMDTAFRIKLYQGPTYNRDQIKGLLNRNFARTQQMLEAVVKPVTVKETGNAAAVETASWMVMRVKDPKGVMRTIRIKGKQRHIWKKRADTWLLAEAVETDQLVTVDGKSLPEPPAQNKPGAKSPLGPRSTP